MEGASSPQHPCFVSPIPCSFSRTSPASILDNRRRPRFCVCRAATNNNNNPREKGDISKRDPISEWVAKARSQSRARRSKSESQSPKSAESTSKQRDGAASALDAVDRLFGTAPALAENKPPNRPIRYSNDNRPVTKEQRQKWLSDLRKANSNPSSVNDDEGNGNGAALTDDNSNNSSATSTRRAPRRTRSRRRKSTSRTNSEEAPFAPADDDPEDGFQEAEINFDKNISIDSTSIRPPAKRNPPPPRRTPRTGATPGNNNNSSNRNASSSSFAKLLDIARHGGASGKKRARKPDFDSMFESLARVNGDNGEQNQHTKNGNGSSRGATRARGTVPVSRAPRKKSSTRSPPVAGAVRQLLDMARETPQADPKESIKETFKNAGALVFDDEDEDVEEYTAKDILGASDSAGLTKTGRPTAFKQLRRRVGGRERKILTPPPDWAPMSEDEIAYIRSESAPLAPKRSIGINLIRDCSHCYGTGLEMCAVCVGTGWVEPLGKKYGVNSKTEALVRDVWERPNLCIHSDGTAQCPYCKGIGKQFCAQCEGSGSAVGKGFDPSTKYQAFDMFQGGRGSPSDIGEDFDEYDDSDEEAVEEEDDDDIESMIYTGEVKGYGFSLPLMETSTLESKKPILEDVVGEEGDENVAVGNGEDGEELAFANGVYDEDHDDFTSKPQRRPMLKGFASLRDEYVPFNNEMTAFDDLPEDDLALLNEAAADEEIEEDESDDDDEDDGVLEEVAVLEATEPNDVATGDIDLLDDVSADELSILDDAAADELPILVDTSADVADADDDALDVVVLDEDDEDSDEVAIADEFEFPNGNDEEEEESEDSVIDLDLESEESEEVLNEGDVGLETGVEIFEDDDDDNDNGGDKKGK